MSKSKKSKTIAKMYLGKKSVSNSKNKSQLIDAMLNNTDQMIKSAQQNIKIKYS